MNAFADGVFRLCASSMKAGFPPRRIGVSLLSVIHNLPKFRTIMTFAKSFSGCFMGSWYSPDSLYAAKKIAYPGLPRNGDSMATSMEGWPQSGPRQSGILELFCGAAGSKLVALPMTCPAPGRVIVIPRVIFRYLFLSLILPWSAKGPDACAWQAAVEHR